MNRAATSGLAWAQLADPLPANGGAGPRAVPRANGTAAEREGWQAVIDGRLAEWQRNPAALEDDGVVAPRHEIIQLAAQVARDLCDAGWPAPERISATGDGGIVF